MKTTKMILEAKSRINFTCSGTVTPSKKKVFTGVVSDLGIVRKKPGGENAEVAWSPIPKDVLVDVCDSILSPADATWYYIRYNKKYGYIKASRIATPSAKPFKFIDYLEKYSKYIKERHKKFHYKYDPNITTFDKAKKKSKVNITCVAPGRWAFADLGIHRKDGSSLIYANKGSFKHCYSGNVKKYLKRITKGGPIGKTYKEAIKDGSLRMGDMVAFKGATHTATYSGDGYKFYDSGRTTFKHGLSKSGIKLDYSKYKDDKRKISEVLRWR